MNIDDRLNHAFSNLEDRVTTTIENQPSPQLQPPPGRPKPVVAFAAAFAVIMAIGIPVVLFQLAGGDGDPTGPGETTTTIATSTTLPPTTTEATTSSTEATETTTTDATSTTVTAAPTGFNPVPDGTLFLVATADGVIAQSGVHESASTVTSRAVAHAVPDHLGGMVFEADGSIYQIESGGTEPKVLVSPQAGEGIGLFNVIDVAGTPHVAYGVTTGGSENASERLYLLDLVGGSLIDVDQTGGIESGLLSVSAQGSVLVIQTAGEGGIFTRGYDLSTRADVSLPNGPEAECWNATDPVLTCPWYAHITNQGLLYVWLDWNGSNEVAPAVVVVDAQSGALQYRVELNPMWVESMDVAWPVVVVNQRVIKDSDWAQGTPTLLDFSDSEGFPWELDTPGAATVWVAAS